MVSQGSAATALRYGGIYNDRKYGNKRHFYIKLHLKDCFGMKFTAI